MVHSSSKAPSRFLIPMETRFRLTSRASRWAGAALRRTNLFVIALTARLDFKPRRRLTPRVRNNCWMISRRLAFFVSFVALLATLTIAVPAARLPAVHTSGNKSLRVMTYNIHVGVGMDKKLDLQRIPDVVNAEHPDLVGLQEVDRGVTRTEFNDEPEGDDYELMRQQFEHAWIVAKIQEPGLSYPADKPVKRIDYIFTRSSDPLRVKRPRIVTTLASDHLPLIADIQIR